MVVESNELEILRMYSEIRAGHTSVVTTFVASAASTVIMGSALLAMLLSGVVGKGIGALLIIGLVLSFLSSVFVCFGWNRVNRSLKRAPNEKEEMPFSNPMLSFPDRTNHFESELPPGSVTERTTNLLSVNTDPARTGEFCIDDVRSAEQ